VMPRELTRALNGAPGEPTSQELAALASALGGALGVALPLPAVAKAAQAVSNAALSGSATVGVSAAKPLAVLGAWVAGGLALGAGLSGVAYSFTTTDDPAPQGRAVASATARAAVASAAVAVPEAAPAAPSTPPVVDARALPLATPSARAPSNQPSPTSTPAPAPESELSLLKRAREATQSNPARALALSAEHAKLYPRGALEQEREVIAIDALLRLGRQTEAAARAKQFQERFAGSAHARRLSTLFTGG
jgi:hypothetical protein